MRKIFFVLLAVLLFSGCAEKNFDLSAVFGQAQTAPQVATQAVNVVSNDTLADRIFLEVLRSADEDRAQYLIKLEQLAQISVIDYTEDDQTIIATVSVVAPNMYALAKDMENEAFVDATSMDENVCARLEACEDYVTNTCTLTFRYVEEELAVNLSEEFFDALYGGLMTYRNEYLKTQEAQ